jgi:hypothetical protein
VEAFANKFEGTPSIAEAEAMGVLEVLQIERISYKWYRNLIVKE